MKPAGALGDLSPFASLKALNEWLQGYAAGQYPEAREYLRNAGTEILRFKIKGAILLAASFDDPENPGATLSFGAAAARHTRSLVRHMKATGLLVNEDPDTLSERRKR